MLFRPGLASVLCLPALLALAAGLFHPAIAQISEPTLVVSCRPYVEGNGCESAPPACEAATSQETEGVYEILVYGYGQDQAGISSAAFELAFPAGWTVLDWSACRAPLVTGDPAVPGSPIEIHLDDCAQYDVPLLRLVVDCTSPGRFSLERQATTYCGGVWDGFVRETYLDIGQFCGRLPIPTPCESLICYHELAGRFERPTVDVQVSAGGAWDDTTSVSMNYCIQLPECGNFDFPCAGLPRSDVEWMTVEPLDLVDGERPFVLHVDAADLGAGSYEGRVWIGDPSGCCTETCMTVSLLVAVVPVQTESWGGLRGRFRR